MTKTWMNFAMYFMGRLKNRFVDHGHCIAYGHFFLRLSLMPKRAKLQLEAMQEYCAINYRLGVPARIRKEISRDWWK